MVSLESSLPFSVLFVSIIFESVFLKLSSVLFSVLLKTLLSSDLLVMIESSLLVTFCVYYFF
jgi:hypothetical protein